MCAVHTLCGDEQRCAALVVGDLGADAAPTDRHGLEVGLAVTAVLDSGDGGVCLLDPVCLRVCELSVENEPQAKKNNINKRTLQGVGPADPCPAESAVGQRAAPWRFGRWRCGVYPT